MTKQKKVSNEVSKKEASKSIFSLIAGVKNKATKPIMEVMYRTDSEGGFAYMPYDMATYDGLGEGYFERGYHNAVSHNYVLDNSKPGASKEFKEHFEAFYHDFEVKEIKRRVYSKWIKAYKEILK